MRPDLHGYASVSPLLAMNKTLKLNIWYLLAAIIGIVVVQQFIRQAGETEEIPYSEFERLVAEQMVAKVVVTDRHIVGQYKIPHSGKTQFVTVRVDLLLIAKLHDSGIEVNGGEESNLLALPACRPSKPRDRTAS